MHNLQAKKLQNFNKDSYIDSEEIYIDNINLIKNGTILNLNRSSIRFKQYTNKKKIYDIILFANSSYLFASKEKLKFKKPKRGLFIRVYGLFKLPKGVYLIDKMPKEVELMYNNKRFAKAQLTFGDNFYLIIKEVI